MARRLDADTIIHWFLRSDGTVWPSVSDASLTFASFQLSAKLKETVEHVHQRIQRLFSGSEAWRIRRASARLLPHRSSRQPRSVPLLAGRSVPAVPVDQAVEEGLHAPLPATPKSTPPPSPPPSPVGSDPLSPAESDMDVEEEQRTRTIQVKDGHNTHDLTFEFTPDWGAGALRRRPSSPAHSHRPVRLHMGRWRRGAS